MGLALKVAILLFLVDSAVAAQKYRQLPLNEDYTFQRNCFSTYFPAAKPRTLLFCSMFNDNSCCSPALDQTNLDYFRALNDVGKSCRIRGDYRDNPIAKIYCMNCDPQQPAYVRNIPYYNLMGIESFLKIVPLAGYPSSRNGFANIPTNVCFADKKMLDYSTAELNLTLENQGLFWNDISTIASTVQKCFATRNQQILISKQWVKKHLTLNDHVFGIFDQCMMQKSAPCLDEEGAIVPNRARFTCGNDPVMPSASCGLDSEDICTSFNNNGTSGDTKVPTNEICKEFMNEKCFNMDDLMTPDIQENFGFRLVDDSACTDDAYGSWKASYTLMLSNMVVQNLTAENPNNLSTTQGNTINLLKFFNPVIANGPACLMNAIQVKDINGWLAQSPRNLTEGYFQAEKCFNGAAALTTVPMMVVLLLVVCLSWFV